MEPSLYVETTIPSYLVGGISPNLATAAHQMATRRWWEERRDPYRLFVSSAVDDEIRRGDVLLSRQRQSVLVGVPRLPVTDEVIRIAEELFAHLKLPISAKMDAFHLAASSHYRMDYLLTWNLKHIAGGRVRLALSHLHDVSGIHIPVICTPEELVEWEEQL
jgi:predicted nucleic acid-binding protein